MKIFNNKLAICGGLGLGLAAFFGYQYNNFRKENKELKTL